MGMLAGKNVNLFSDLLVHNMGPGLADNVVQGSAGPDEFRTAPLWGVGQRIFFLHDGRTTDLIEAIRAHSSPADGQFRASEANGVVAFVQSASGSAEAGSVEFPAIAVETPIPPG